MVSDDAVRLQGTVPREDYALLEEKFRASTEGTEASLLRALIDDWRRLRELEASRSAGEYVALDGPDNDS